MRHWITRAAAVAAIASVWFASVPAEAEVASGAVLINVCFSCHGTDGKSAGDMPTIAGKSETFIVKKLRGFRSGEIEATIMGRIAKGFTDAEILALARFFSGK